MSRFTPGPWRVSKSSMATVQRIDNPLICHGGSNIFSPLIAEIYSDGGRLPAKANARLIAAAPELYEALSMAIEAMRDHNIDESMAGEFEILTDALAKVEGKEVMP